MKDIDPQWQNFKNPEGDDGFPDDLKYSVRYYKKNDIVFLQGDLCDALYLVTSGSVKTEMTTESGNTLGIEIIKAPRPLAPAFIFSANNRFPVTVTALENLEILRIPQNEIVRLMSINPQFMQQFLQHNANRTQFLTNRLQLLTIKSLKGRVAHFLLEQSEEHGNPFILNRNKTELAEFMGVARPSLARSISEMIEDGIIKVKRNEYHIIDQKKLHELLI